MNKDNGIWNELEEVSSGLVPFLKDIKERGNRSFRVPDGYFRELNSEVFALIESGLADVKGGSPDSAFSVPGNYFAELTGNIMDRIESETAAGEETDAGHGRVIRLQSARRREPVPLRRWTVMAASVALFITLGILAARFINSDNSNNRLPMAAGPVSQEEVLDYLEETIEDPAVNLGHEEFLALLDMSSTTVTEEAVDISSELEEELHEYLEEHIDYVDEYLLTGEI